jgi:hypothetical protein
MIRLLNFLVVLTLIIVTACNGQTINNGADFEFNSFDSDSNELEFKVTIRYQLGSTLERKLSNKYNEQYKNGLLLPIISSISDQLMKDYTALEIYNYKRKEIEEKLKRQTKQKFVEYDIDLNELFIRSVGLSDSLRNQLQEEHLRNFQSAMNSCTKETKGVVTEIHSMGDQEDLIFYTFIVENKSYDGIPRNEQLGMDVKVGDSLEIEYACENP